MEELMARPDPIRLEFSPEVKRTMTKLTLALEGLKFNEAKLEEFRQAARKTATQSFLDEHNHEIFVIGDEVYTTRDGDVISWNGQRFYLACEKTVLLKPDLKTTCILREGHEGQFHVDWDGVMRDVNE